MEWYYIALIVILILFFLIAVTVYLLFNRILQLIGNRIIQSVLVSIFGAGYVVSPIDFIPEIIMPLIGFLDDIGVIVGVVGYVANGVKEYQNKKIDEEGYFRYKGNNRLIQNSGVENKSKFNFFNRQKKNIIQRRALCRVCGFGVEETEIYCKKCGSKLNMIEEY